MKNLGMLEYINSITGQIFGNEKPHSLLEPGSEEEFDQAFQDHPNLERTARSREVLQVPQ